MFAIRLLPKNEMQILTKVIWPSDASKPAQTFYPIMICIILINQIPSTAKRYICSTKFTSKPVFIGYWCVAYVFANEAHQNSFMIKCSTMLCFPKIFSNSCKPNVISRFLNRWRYIQLWHNQTKMKVNSKINARFNVCNGDSHVYKW